MCGAGCAAFSVAVTFPDSAVGTTFRWGVSVDGPAGRGVWAIPTEVRRADRFEQFATAAATEAIQQSGLPGGDSFRNGVIIGTGIGGLHTIKNGRVLCPNCHRLRHEKK